MAVAVKRAERRGFKLGSKGTKTKHKEVQRKADGKSDGKSDNQAKESKSADGKSWRHLKPSDSPAHSSGKAARRLAGKAGEDDVQT